MADVDCTFKCRSCLHGSQVVSALTKRADYVHLLAYLRTICYNFAHVSDPFGRSALHIAASCGHYKLIDWLITNENADHKAKDRESGWTPLHRSLYYGYLSAAKVLIEHGANLKSLDHGGCSPLDLVKRDRPIYIEFSADRMCDAYVWGTNTNFTLGLETSQSRKYPEVVERFRKNKQSVEKVVMGKYHTVFLTQEGHAHVCGHGQGGRLGLDSEQTTISPVEVKLPELCVDVAAGTNHTVFLTANGTVLTCGLNSYHQLGQVPPTQHSVAPKPIKFIKNVHFSGICAARFHTVVYNKDAVFTFGLNAGQLGHPKEHRTQINPRQVSSLTFQDKKIHLVAASDGATVCAMDKGDIYVLHEYRCRRIVSKHLQLVSLHAIGGNLDATVDPKILKDRGGKELKIVLLDKNGLIYLWQESVGQLSRCFFLSARPVHIVDVSLNASSILFVTKDGDTCVGLKLPKKLSPRGDKSPNQGKEVFGDGRMDKMEVEMFQVKYLQRLHRSVRVSCDPKGENFAVVQCHPARSIFDFPDVGLSQMQKQFDEFLKHSDVDDSIHDVVLKVGTRQFAAHKYILSFRSEYFNKLLKSHCCGSVNDNVNNDHYDDDDDDVPKMDVVAVTEVNDPILFGQILQYVYTDTCDFLKNGHKLPPPVTISPPNVNSDKSGNHRNGNRNNGSQSASKCPDNRETVDLNLDNLHRISAFSVVQKSLSTGTTAGGGKKQPQRKKSNEKFSDRAMTTVNKNQVVDPVRKLHDVAIRLDLPVLSKLLNKVKHALGMITEVPPEASNQSIRFDRNELTELYDVRLECEDGREILCHKSVLVARSEYFHSMLASGWLEAHTNEVLQLPVSAKVLEVVIDFLYTDEAPSLETCEEKDFICQVLILSDQLLLGRLKEICEKSLAYLISLRDATELLELSCVYQAKQLQATCLEFICVNLPSILEANGLSVLSDEALEALDENYRQRIPACRNRVITPYFDCPKDEDLRKCVVGNNESSILTSSSNRDVAYATKKAKTKRKHQTRRTSSSEAMSTSPILASVVSPPILVKVGPQPPTPPTLSTIDTPQPVVVYSLSVITPTADKAEERKNSRSSPGQNLTTDSKLSSKVIGSPTPDLQNSPRWAERSLQQSLQEPRRSDLMTLDEIMQEQEQEEARPSQAVPKTSRKVNKLSQKQRKKMAVSDKGSPPSPVFEDPKPKNAWHKPTVVVQSLDEIMENEEQTPFTPVLWKHLVEKPETSRWVASASASNRNLVSPKPAATTSKIIPKSNNVKSPTDKR